MQHDVDDYDDDVVDYRLSERTYSQLSQVCNLIQISCTFSLFQRATHHVVNAAPSRSLCSQSVCLSVCLSLCLSVGSALPLRGNGRHCRISSHRTIGLGFGLVVKRFRQYSQPFPRACHVEEGMNISQFSINISLYVGIKIGSWEHQYEILRKYRYR